MAVSPSWFATATDTRVLRRAAITSLGVGSVLTVVNHWDELFNGGMAPASALPVVITYLVPFLVSLASSVIALRVERRDTSAASSLLEREIQAINKFPDQNPNPVLRMTEAGGMTYANPAAALALAGLGVAVGGDLASDMSARLREAAAAEPPRVVEIEHLGRTLAVLAVHVPELRAYNLYCTDITAAKVVERFPDRNPSPVLRMTPGGELRYANAASKPITNALGINVGDRLPDDLYEALRSSLGDATALAPELAGEGGRTYRVQPVLIPEFDFVNLYATDVTAERAMNKFPDQNPNPVLRLTRAGRMTYANPASALVRQALGTEVGEDLQPPAFARIVAACEHPTEPTMEVEADGTIYRLRVVAVSEFDSIGLYGTDITALRKVEELSAANEHLLLNILPQSIADRLRGGELVIADRFDDMAVLFADVVGFTELSSRLEPGEVVRLLNDVFSTCDRLADRFGLEKIKTVGDAYMVVGGLYAGPGSDGRQGGTHAADVADMGLAMLDELARHEHVAGIGLQVRLGMHVGPAVAGVIGLKKFIYDVWGDTVNMASRMESTGLPGRLQVARETYQALQRDFEFEARGLVDVKGKGQIETWFVRSRREPAQTSRP